MMRPWRFARHLREALDDARFPYAPRLVPLKSTWRSWNRRSLSPNGLPPLKAIMGPSHGQGRRRR